MGDRATPEERAYFDRIAKANRALVGVPPTSFSEALQRLEALQQQLGVRIDRGASDPDGDWASHLSFIRHLHEVTDLRRGRRPR